MDLAHAFRRLMRAPGFAAIAILTLALGIGANTAIFSLVKTVLLRPLPFGDPDRLAMIWGARVKGETSWLSASEILSYRKDGADVFADVATYTTTARTLTGGQEPERVIAAAVSPNLFATLDVGALVGRTFAAADSAAMIADQVVIGHGLWTRRFGGDRAIVGQTIQLHGRASTVIGVMPPGFRLPLDFASERPSELWVPADLSSSSYEGWGNRSFIGVARLRDNVSHARATARMIAIESSWAREGYLHIGPEGLGRSAVSADELVIGDVRLALWVLLGAVGVILLIACANVANLMLARADERHREIAVRTALGASRARIIKQLLTESVLVSAIGAAAGLGLAYGGLRALVALRPAGIPRAADAGLDGFVLLFALLLAVVTGVVFGLAPALELSRPDLNRSLKEGGRTGSVGIGRQRFRDGLAVAQMAFSVVLLIGAMLLVRSFIELRRVDLGFDRESALTARTSLPLNLYPTNETEIAFYKLARHRLGELPGVRQAGATRLLPLTGTIGDWSITIEGRQRVEGDNPNGDWQVVTPGYFEAMGMRLATGRWLSDGDHEKAPLAAVINETMAKRYWPGEDAIGKRFHINTDNRPWITIVGIIGQVRHNAVTETPRAEMYVSHAQWAVAGGGTPLSMTWVLRTQGDPLALVGHFREAIRTIDPNVPIADIRTLESVADNSLSQARFTTLLLAAFAALALTIATIGIYGVISLLVARRRQEIGIRIALGARPAMILRMVLRRGMTLAGIGVIVGIAGALALTSVLSTLLYGVGRFDAATFAAIPLLLAAVALVASLIPAGRAATVDPIVALRDD